ncbi:MAG: glycerol-3-phosphate acyltransferase [Evtepia gabavorous]
MGEFWIRAVAAAAIAYFCGCFNGAVIVSKYILRDDVRTHGSGNAGLTNFYRTFGGPLTFGVILTDVLKAIGPGGGRLAAGGPSSAGCPAPEAYSDYWAGLFCRWGMFPVCSSSRGAKAFCPAGPL